MDSGQKKLSVAFHPNAGACNFFNEGGGQGKRTASVDGLPVLPLAEMPYEGNSCQEAIDRAFGEGSYVNRVRPLVDYDGILSKPKADEPYGEAKFPVRMIVRDGAGPDTMEIGRFVVTEVSEDGPALSH
ncbi:MAG: hypothetical protein KDI13_08395 [Alphaproteobacteria bacterium]|nr:hypothetical protein [Alphaproteobacteria bacterium]